MKSSFYILVFLCTIGSLSNCYPETNLQNESSSLRLEKKDYLNVLPNRIFQFPQDHKPHFGYQTEWWYYTGFFYTDPESSNKELDPILGIQFTLFKTELQPNRNRIQPYSILFSTHIGIADLENQQLYKYESITRYSPGLSRIQESWDGFSIQAKSKNLNIKYGIQDKVHQIFAKSSQVPNKEYLLLNMNLTQSLPIILQGNNGVSSKDEFGTSSYYYSIPLLEGKGVIFHPKQQKPIPGKFQVWLDHEFSSQFLHPTKVGWDWLHFTMEDGTWYVAFQVRDKDPNKNFSYARSNRQNYYSKIQFSPLSRKTMPSGRTYPIQWKLILDNEEYLIRALIPNSEMEGFLPYWEGPISVEWISTKSFENNQPPIKKSGKGYLEMTGYDYTLPSWL